jgi:hypothetical protein
MIDRSRPTRALVAAVLALHTTTALPGIERSEMTRDRVDAGVFGR